MNAFVSLEGKLQCSLRGNARYSSNFSIVFKTKGKLADDEEIAIFHGHQSSSLEVTVYCELPPKHSFLPSSQWNLSEGSNFTFFLTLV